MAKINYTFVNPVPRSFYDNGLMKNKNVATFVAWAFSRCSHTARYQIKGYKQFYLEPNQFLFSRKICHEQTGLTYSEIATVVKNLIQISRLKKTYVSTKYGTIFELNAQGFSNIVYNPISTPNSTPVNMQKISFNMGISGFLNFDNTLNRTPDSTFYQNIYKESKENLQKETGKSEEFSIDFSVEQKPRISRNAKTNHIMHEIYLSDADLEKCLKLCNGEMNELRRKMQIVLDSTARLHEIKNWPRTLAKWDFKEKKTQKSIVADRMSQNKIIAKEYLKMYEEFSNDRVWRCNEYHDAIKDDYGILWTQDASRTNCHAQNHVSYYDPNFKIQMNRLVEANNYICGQKIKHVESNLELIEKRRNKTKPLLKLYDSFSKADAVIEEFSCPHTGDSGLWFRFLDDEEQNGTQISYSHERFWAECVEIASKYGLFDKENQKWLNT